MRTDVFPVGARVTVIDGPGPTLQAQQCEQTGTVVGGCDEPGLRRVLLDGRMTWDVLPVTQLQEVYACDNCGKETPAHGAIRYGGCSVCADCTKVFARRRAEVAEAEGLAQGTPK